MNQKMFRSSLFLNLPSEMLINILSRLPIQTILSCKCVCKQLLNLLSTPEFAESHLPLSTTGLLILQSPTERINLCQIFEYDDGYELQDSNIHLRPVMEFDPNVSLGLPDVDLWVVGSVNGLLCLREYRDEVYDALYICNPITREYIALPRIESINRENGESCEYGFGVSKITGQYKVVRNADRDSNDPQVGTSSSECLVYTVGTRSWRKVQPGGAPFGLYHLPFSLFLNGNLHGSVLDYEDLITVSSIHCFDLESELFKPFFPPLPPVPYPPIFGTLGILDDRLCFFKNGLEDSELSIIWVMKEYDRADRCWTEILAIGEDEGFDCLGDTSVCPIKAFKNGDILLNWDNRKLFYYSSKTKTRKNVDITIRNKGGWIDAIPHRLSFLSLNIFDGENVISFS